jgi:hypothetical protein
VESLATQTLIIFAIRTRRVPFFRSRPSGVLTLATFATIAVGVVLTVSPLAHNLGFTLLPWQFFTALVLLTVGYPVLVEVTKTVFYTDPVHLAGQPHRTRGHTHRIQRRAARFTTAARSPTRRPGPPRYQRRPGSLLRMPPSGVFNRHIATDRQRVPAQSLTGGPLKRANFSNTLAPVSAHRYCARIGKLSRY